jgi:hypothetical protein
MAGVFGIGASGLGTAGDGLQARSPPMVPAPGGSRRPAEQPDETGRLRDRPARRRLGRVRRMGGVAGRKVGRRGGESCPSLREMRWKLGSHNLHRPGTEQQARCPAE